MLAAAVVGAAGLAALYAIDPVGSTVYPPCLFHSLTGLHCPGCGTARGLHQLLHGHLLSALHLNPLMVLCLPLVIASLLLRLLRQVRGRPRRMLRIRPRWIWGLLVVVIAFWVLRNVPVYPFSLLAPP